MDRPLANRVRRLLTQRAQQSDTIYYSALGRAVGVHHRSNSLYAALNTIACEEYLAERPPLAAVAVRMDSGRPGQAFFLWAIAMGLMGRKSGAEYWEKAIKDVWNYWS